jgi:hypothetical protein
MRIGHGRIVCSERQVFGATQRVRPPGKPARAGPVGRREGEVIESVVQPGPAVGLIRPPSPHQHEIPMSADKDRGIRRQKQKRAKDKKKLARQQPASPSATSTAAAKPAKKAAA